MASFGSLYVNKLNGNVLLSAPAPSYPIANTTLSASLSYNSLGTKDVGLGRGWTLSSGADLSLAPSLSDLNPDQDAAQVDWPDGHTTVYGHVAGSGEFRSPPGDTTRLFRNDDGTWSLSAPAGDTFAYGTDLNVTSFQSARTTPGQAKLTFTYSSGKPTKTADASGRALTFTWNSLNAAGCPSAIVCITVPDGRTWKYVGHNSGGTVGPVERVNDGTRDVLALGYDLGGRIVKLQNANDLTPGAATPGYDPTHSVQMGYDSSGRVTSVNSGPISGQTPSTSTWMLAYNTASVLTDATRVAHAGTAAGVQRTATSSTTLYQPNQVGSPSPVGTTTYYDEFNKAIEVKDPLGNVKLAGYSTKDQLLWSEDADGNPIDNTYDPVTGVLNRTTTPDPSSDAGSVTTQYRYDEATMGTTGAAGQTLGGLAAIYFKNQNRAGGGDAQRIDSTIDFNWGAGGPSVLGGQSDTFSVRWTGYLDVAQTGDYVLSTVADGGTSVVVDQYTLISDIGGGGPHTKNSQSVHLKSGLHPILVEYADLTGSAEVHLRWRCSSCATPISTQIVPASALQPGYENRTSVITPGGSVSFTHYSVAWRRLADYDLDRVNGTNAITSYRYDAYGRRIQKVMPKGNAARTVDAGGDLTGIVDARYVTNSTYYGDTETAAPPAACGGAAVSQAGQLKSKSPYGVHPTTLVYDLAGREVASTNAVGTSCSTYDSEDRLTQETIPGEAQPTTYSYDPAGEVRTATDANGTITLGYDEAGRIKFSTDSFGSESSFAYDRDNNLVLRRTAVGTLAAGPVFTTSYGFDNSDQMTSLVDPAGRNYVFFYTNSGLPKATQYPNGTFSWTAYNRPGTVKAVYNRHGALPSPLPGSVPADSQGSPLVDDVYTFNMDGKRTQDVWSGGGLTTQTSTYAYDGLGRLSTVALPDGTNRTYNYDLDSNRTSVVENGSTVQTYSYDPATTPGVDELTSVTRGGSTTTFTYTPDGQTQTRGADTLTWDGRGHSKGGTFAGQAVAYMYDALGRIRSRVGLATARYLYAGGEPSFETNTGGSIVTTDVSGPDGPVASYVGAPAIGNPVSFLYYSAHGDAAAEADANGVRIATHTYDPFGAPLDTRSADKRLRAWVGKWDKRYDTTGMLIQMGARPYDPSLGRFLAPDPVDGGSCNPYDYACQDPVNNFDLDGTVCGSGTTDWLFDDHDWFFNFTAACKFHDHCYGTWGGPDHTKKYCDEEFYDRMLEDCKSRNFAARPLCRARAYDFFHGARSLGKASWLSGQVKDCVAKQYGPEKWCRKRAEEKRT
jgi:RHS repeat-associated protein